MKSGVKNIRAAVTNGACTVIIEITKKNDNKITITGLIELPKVGSPKKAGINIFSKSNCIINNPALWQAQYVLNKHDSL